MRGELVFATGVIVVIALVVASVISSHLAPYIDSIRQAFEALPR